MTNVKFRAYWEGEMRQVLVIDWLNELVDLEGGHIEIPFNEVNLMQYTEFKDGYGNEICEGDIVINTGLWALHSTNRLQYSRKIYGEGVKFVVHLNVTGVELRHLVDWNQNTKKDFAPNGYHSKPYVDSHDAWNLQRTLEVIGNIYESPELTEVN